MAVLSPTLLCKALFLDEEEILTQYMHGDSSIWVAN